MGSVLGHFSSVSSESHVDVRLSLLFLDGGAGETEKSIGLCMYKLLIRSILKSVVTGYYH